MQQYLQGSLNYQAHLFSIFVSWKMWKKCLGNTLLAWVCDRFIVWAERSRSRMVQYDWYWSPGSRPNPPSFHPTHSTNLSCREVLENTAWLQIRDHWQMIWSLFFWGGTESKGRQNLDWQIKRFGGCYGSAGEEKGTSGECSRSREESDMRGLIGLHVYCLCKHGSECVNAGGYTQEGDRVTDK